MPPDDTAAYVQQLTGCQSRLYGYIYSLLGNAEAASDVLQETNTVLWRKAADYDPKRPFLPWALGIAFNQVRAARARFGRDRLVFHDQQTLDALSAGWLADEHARRASDMEVAMDGCLKRLPTRHQDVVRRHYRHGESLAAIATALNRTANAVGVMLHRIRRALARCIQRAQATTEHPLGESPLEG